MNKGLRLISSDFHFLSFDNADEYVEWLTVDTAHPALAKFIRDVPTGEKVVLRFTKSGRLELEDGSCTWYLDVDLPVYLCSQSEFASFLGMLSEGQEAHFTKCVWTAKKYNHWLQFESGCCDSEVYPEVCPKCGCLMACSSEHYRKRSNNWQRVRCTNGPCGHVIAKDAFVEVFRAKNQKKLVGALGHILSDHAHDLTVIDASGVPIQEPFPWKDASNDFCRECGGDVGPWRIVRSSRMTSVLYACARCFGSSHTQHTGILLDEEIRANIERAREELAAGPC